MELPQTGKRVGITQKNGFQAHIAAGPQGGKLILPRLVLNTNDTGVDNYS